MGEENMDRMKTFFKYAMWVILFMILSEFLINVGLNSTYKPIERKDSLEQIEIYQAEATLVNGRIRGIIKNSQTQNISGKYLEINLYSKRDVLLGKQYIKIEELNDNDIQSFEALFKLENVSYYDLKIVEQKDETKELVLLPKNLTKSEVILATAITLLIFW